MVNASLIKEEYNENYYQGGSNGHPAGYSSYVKPNIDLRKVIDIEKLKDKKVVELGCATGDFVTELRNSGIDCIGIDFSDYIVNYSNNEYVLKRDALDFVSKLEDDSIDLIYSIRFLECLNRLDLELLKEQLNRVAKKQIHIIGDYPNSKYYTDKSVSDWAKLGFKDTNFIKFNTL